MSVASMTYGEGQPAAGVVVARYLSPRIREALAATNRVLGRSAPSPRADVLCDFKSSGSQPQERTHQQI